MIKISNNYLFKFFIKKNIGNYIEFKFILGPLELTKLL